MPERRVCKASGAGADGGAAKAAERARNGPPFRSVVLNPASATAFSLYLRTKSRTVSIPTSGRSTACKDSYDYYFDHHPRHRLFLPDRGGAAAKRQGR